MTATTRFRAWCGARRRLPALLACLALLAGCGAPQHGRDGIGGTGVRSDPDGIGGTGIVGTVTAVGSIVVNGLHIGFDPALPIRFNGTVTAASTLRPGHVVEIVAHATPAGLEAREIEVFDLVAGPVSEVDHHAGRLTILGQLVETDPRTRARAEIRIGARLRVSGLRRADGQVLATRIEAIGDAEPAFVSGRVTALAGDGFSLGNVRVISPAAGLNTGDRVQATGRAVAPARLEADAVTQRPRTPFGGTVERLVLEGFAQVDASGTHLRGATLSAPLPADTELRGIERPALRRETRIVVTATMRPGAGVQIEDIAPVDRGAGSADDPSDPTLPGATSAPVRSPAETTGDRYDRGVIDSGRGGDAAPGGSSSRGTGDSSSSPSAPSSGRSRDAGTSSKSDAGARSTSDRATDRTTR